MTKLAALSNQMQNIQRQIRKMAKEEKARLYTIRDMAGLVGKTPAQLSTDIYAGLIPNPAQQRAGGSDRKYYSDDDIPTINKYYMKKKYSPRGHKAVKRAGYYSRQDIADACGTACSVLDFHEKHGDWKPPTHKYPKHNLQYRYYNRHEAETIIKYWFAHATPMRGMHRKHPVKIIGLGE